MQTEAIGIDRTRVPEGWLLALGLLLETFHREAPGEHGGFIRLDLRHTCSRHAVGPNVQDMLR